MQSTPEHEDSCVSRELCSMFSRNQAEDPIGTATPFGQHLMIELPLPWASELASVPHFPAGALASIKRAHQLGRPTRVQAVVPDAEYSLPGHTRIVHLRKPTGPFARYDRQEFLVPSEQAGALITALLLEPAALAQFEPWRQHNEGIRDLLVCTHGAIDACCGKLGYPLFSQLRREYGSSDPTQLRVWRSSHFGGHRFAPTLLDFPEGRCWAHIAPEHLESLVRREGSPADLRYNYRGWNGVDRTAQLVEREIFALEGWAWIDYHKCAMLLESDEAQNRCKVRIEYTSPDSLFGGAYEGTVEACGTRQLNGCIRGEKPSVINQYHVVGLQKIAQTVPVELYTPAWSALVDAVS